MAERVTRIISAPSFIADPQSISRLDGRQIDWNFIPENDRVTPGFIVTTSGAAAAATTLPVTAIAGPIKAGTILDFTGAGEFALVTADAAAGATSLTVEALDAAIENTDTAIVAGTGPKFLRAGTVVAVVNPGTNNKLQRRDGTHAAIGLLASDAIQDDRSASLSGHGVIVGGVVYEPLLPDSTGSPRTLNGTIKTELAAAGNGFVYAPSVDDSIS